LQEASLGCFARWAACPAKQERQAGGQQGADGSREQRGGCWPSAEALLRV